MKRNLFKLCYGLSTSYTKAMSIGGINFGQGLTTTGEVTGTADVTIPAAVAGTVTTHTTNIAGTITASAPQVLITTGARVDLYWAGGWARDVTVGTVSGAGNVTIPISYVQTTTFSDNANFPASGAINVALPVEVAFPVVGNNLVALVVESPYEALFSIVDASEVDLAHYHPLANAMLAWTSGEGTANPLVGVTAAKIWMSHGDPLAAHDLLAANMRSA
jgi:hypothetical protein